MWRFPCISHETRACKLHESRTYLAQCCMYVARMLYGKLHGCCINTGRVTIQVTLNKSTLACILQVLTCQMMLHQNAFQSFRYYEKSKQCLNLINVTGLVIISAGFSTMIIFSTVMGPSIIECPTKCLVLLVKHLVFGNYTVV